MSAEIEIRPTTYAEWYALEEERDQLRAELETARAALVEQIEARQVTEAEGGALQQANNEIDRLQAELSRLRSAPVAVEVPEQRSAEPFMRENRFLVLKRTDLERWATPSQLRELERTCEMIRAGRLSEGKRIDSYVVVADDWPEYEETWAKIEARVTGQPIPPSRLLNDGERAVRWIPVDESLPEDGERVGFIVDCKRDDFMHGRVYGGRFNRRDWDERWGGFNTHGLGARASHWCRLPPVPDAIRSSKEGAA